MSIEKLPPDVPKEPEGTAERIIAAATRLFAAKGFDGTSTKEICDAASANIAAIHYHFGSKEDLYQQIIESFGDSSLRAVQRILQPPNNHEEFKVRILLFIEEALESFLQSPDICRIVQSEVGTLMARSEKVFRRTFLKRFETLVEFLDPAKRHRIVAKGIDPEFAARSLFAQIYHQTRGDDVHKKFYGVTLRDPEYRGKWIKQTLCMFVRAVTNQP